MTWSLQDEIVAAGVGENLMVQVKPVDRTKPHVWHQIPGQSFGYQAGTGDVTAVSVVERQGRPGVVVGRATGDLQTLTEEDNFTASSLNLTPTNHDGLNRGFGRLSLSPGQRAIAHLQWQPETNMLASCRGTTLNLYDLSNEDGKLNSTASWDFSKDSPQDEASLLRNVKFMSKDVLACALGGSREPLRWGQITPTGIEFVNAARNPRLGDVLPEIKAEDKTAIRAIEPVNGGGNGNLLLSAWADGTYRQVMTLAIVVFDELTFSRLTDIRTPSPHDAIYQDGFQPYESGSSLLVYGMERFVAGSNTAPSIRLFDFRQPKAYRHTAALPCSGQPPYPALKDDYFKGEGVLQPTHVTEKCQSRNRQCTWHSLSEQEPWRPDATLHIGSPTYDRIYCLAKASDLSDTIYCGLRGAVMEMNLHLTNNVAPSHPERAVPPGWKMGRPGGKVSLIETGVSLCQSRSWSRNSHVVPELIVQQPQPQARLTTTDGTKQHRLDMAFQRPQDFSTF